MIGRGTAEKLVNTELLKPAGSHSSRIPEPLDVASIIDDEPLDHVPLAGVPDDTAGGRLLRDRALLREPSRYGS